MFGQITISKALYDALVNQAANAVDALPSLYKAGKVGAAISIENIKDEIAVLTEEEMTDDERAMRRWSREVDAGYQRAVERRAGE